MLYQIFRLCERFGIDPERWDEYNFWTQASLLSYEEIREKEEWEVLELNLNTRTPLI
jgi:hypothetical protein